MKKYNITVNGTKYEVCVEEVDDFTKNAAGTAFSAQAPTINNASVTQATAAFNISMPITVHIPGTITDIKVSLGQYVNKGDIICTLEAMKIENDIPSPQSGTVSAINVQKGTPVNAGDTIIILN